MPPWAPLDAAPTSRLLAGPAGTPGFPSLHCAGRGLAGAHAPRQGTALGPGNRVFDASASKKTPGARGRGRVARGACAAASSAVQRGLPAAYRRAGEEP